MRAQMSANLRAHECKCTLRRAHGRRKAPALARTAQNRATTLFLIFSNRKRKLIVSHGQEKRRKGGKERMKSKADNIRQINEILALKRQEGKY